MNIPGITRSQFDLANLECNTVWKIINGCETFEDTASAQKCVDFYEERNGDKDTIKDMREEIFQISYRIFSENKK